MSARLRAIDWRSTSLGTPGRWPAAWGLLAPRIDEVIEGRASMPPDDEVLPVQRPGPQGTPCWTCSFSPIPDADAPGGVGGALMLCREATPRGDPRWQAIFRDAAVAMSLTDAGGHYLEVNPACCELMDYTATELQGMSCLDRTHPDHRSAGREAVRQLCSREIRNWRGICRYLRRNGDVIACDVSISVVDAPDGSLGGYVAQVQDVTARGEALHALAVIRQRFEVALTNSPIVVFTQDRQLRCTRVYNPALGYDPEQVLGKTDHPLFGRARDAETVEAIKRDVMATGRSQSHAVQVLQERRERSYDLQVAPLRSEDGTIEGVVCAAVNITERLDIERTLREERRKLGLALKAGRMGIYENDRVNDTVWWSPEMHVLFGVDPERFVPTRDSFLALVHPQDREDFLRTYETGFRPGQIFAHDFRIVRPDGEVRWIGNRALPTHDDDGRIPRHVVSHVSLGKVRLAVSRFDLGAAVEQGIEMARPAIDAMGHRLGVTLPTIPITLLGDASRIAQVRCNLMANAAKYTDPGGSIDISLAPEGTHAVIRVKDTGIGLDPQDLPGIFNMFGQVDRSRHRSSGGMGIGLVLARNLVQLHGGSIYVQSPGLGQGSEFTVRLPLAPPPHLSPFAGR